MGHPGPAARICRAVTGSRRCHGLRDPLLPSVSAHRAPVAPRRRAPHAARMDRPPEGSLLPILVTGAAGSVGAVGRTVVEILRQRDLPVRAMVRRDDERAEALRATGAEVVVGDLTRAG